MTPYYEDDHCTIYHGESLNVLASLPNGCVQVILLDQDHLEQRKARRTTR